MKHPTIRIENHYPNMKLKKMYISVAIIGILILSVVIFMNLPRFGSLPSGERLKRLEQSPNYKNGAFHNQNPTPQFTSEKSKIGTMLDFLFEKRERNRPDRAIPALKSDLKNLSLEQNLVVWFGHSSYFLQIDGKRILIDPVFYDASPVSFFNKAFKGTDIYKAEDMPDIDYLVITHDHWDHLDHKTFTKLKDRIGKVICPLGVGAHLEYWGYSADKLVELDWYEQSKLDDNYIVHCLPTRHFSGRTFKANQSLWASFMLKTPTETVYIGGDGGYDQHFAEIAQQYPSIDLALMENGQYNQDWRYIHLMPEDLVKAIADLHPRNVIAGHNSKYALAKHAWDEPLNNAAGIKSVSMPMIGQIVYLEDSMDATNSRWWEKMDK